ncbi:MAG: glycoside hydrolase family 97 protein [Melioribacteraceae bacterium]|nr:glycoside hydrolase family 97 protein [Melioribacteraceae bacterium]
MQNQLVRILVVLFVLFFWSCSNQIDLVQETSPDGNIRVEVFTNNYQKPGYRVFYNDDVIIDSSFIGFDFKDIPSIDKNISIVNFEKLKFVEDWETVWGDRKIVSNIYNQVKINFEETEAPNRKFSMIFRIYDDGLGFRFDFQQMDNVNQLVIMDEKTEFKLTGDHLVWWTPGDWDIYEHLYNTTRLSKIDALKFRNHESLAQTYIPYNAVNTPVTMKTDNNIYLSFHEADLKNYSGMTLKIDTTNFLLTSELVGSPDESKVKLESSSFVTPWRTIQISETPGGLIESDLIINLNEPNKLEDVSWIKPMKYVGIWWEMHLGKSTWDMQSGRHGATTENTKRHIDFAAENNIQAVLVEGWNTGWERWIGFEDREGVFDFVTPYPDYNLDEVINYVDSKGVEIIMHHETSAAVRTYEQQLDTAFALCKKLGINGVKTGYVGKIIPKGEYHHGQFMINHYRKVLETAAKYQIMVNAHEPIKDTGERRTFPNMISREGLRGQEFNAWSSDGGNPPEHLPIVAFTRMLAGPIDYTPGIFDIKFDKYKKENQVNTTLAHQLALYVVISSPIQMAADLLENYEGNDAFQFISDVPVNWEFTKVLNGEIGDFVTIVRKDRNSNNWFLGSITDENPRELNINLNFLDKGKNYTAVIYKDADNAHWNDNPTEYKIEKLIVTSEDKINLKLAAGGGTAISFFVE